VERALTWLKHHRMLRRTAYKLAVHSRKFHVPLRYVKADELRRTEGSAHGVTTHLQITLSGIGGSAGTHTDPGSGYPINLVLAMAKAYKLRLKIVRR
jgi:hypothetical protein